MEHGADIDEPDRYLRYPLASALSQTKFDIVLYLLDQGANYELAECRGVAFLEDFYDKHKNKDVWFLLEEDRAKVDEICEWWRNRGGQLGEDE